MAKLTIYHNPRCTKSRQTLQLLHENGIEPEVVEYLKQPPSKATLKKLVQQLGVEAIDLIRKSELKKLSLDLPTSKTTAIELLFEYPLLMERPVVTNGTSARIGRPPENVLELI